MKCLYNLGGMRRLQHGRGLLCMEMYRARRVSVIVRMLSHGLGVCVYIYIYSCVNRMRVRNK